MTNIMDTKVTSMRVEKRPSTNGFGVFATVDIKAGDLILEVRGTLIRSYVYAKSFSSDQWDHMVQIGKELYLNPTGVARYTNHSCNPNSWPKIDGERLFWVALRDIKKDEEITFDYSITSDEDDWEMDCKCGSKNCRKRIRDFKYLPKRLQDRYIRLKIVPDYVLRSAKKSVI